jgi:hypothetical protein
MKIEFPFKNIGICGDNCEICPRLIATKSNDMRKLEKILSLWIKTGLRKPGTHASSLACNGCSTVAVCAYEDQKKCALNQHLKNCGLCAHYPCDIVKNSFERSDKFAAVCREQCSQGEYRQFAKAFFSKKENLDTIAKRHKGDHQ